ncbi:MAG: lamin tail domain-containing protein, partial [Anaerolineaceae bacterium]|nr:lamin tail domain-containing protein [Anaerolineaceae bacterium]
MIRLKRIALIGMLFSLIAGCATPQISTTPEVTKQAELPTPGLNHLVISEIMAGAEHNNNHDFIELYNPQNEAVDLAGYSLSYQLDRETDYITLYDWNLYTLIPPYGYYLLGYSGETFNLPVDAEFTQNLISSKGSITLLNGSDEIQDSVCWGSQPCEKGEGSPATALPKGKSLERLPGGQAGSTTDTDDNAADFALNARPNPQNTGSPIAPPITGQLQIQINAPQKVNPGEQFILQLKVTNSADTNVENTTVTLPVPAELTISPEQSTAVQINPPFAVWNIPSLEAKSSTVLELAVTAPWSYTSLFTHSYSAASENMLVSIVGAPVRIQVADGSVPIEIAKTLFEVDVVVEGIATMYTDGFFAGSTGTKFYLQDESGGIQVYIPGGKGQVDVSIGDRVRVQGQIELYRGALELIPVSPDDVEIIAQNGETPLPLEVSIAEALQTESLTGKLVTIQGSAARIEEFSYSFEMDLLDDTGQLITVYIDKETNTTIETIENELRYTVAGILEVR